MEAKIVDKFKLRLKCEDLKCRSDRWRHMGLDEHLQASTMSGLIDRYRGASRYINDKPRPSQASMVLVFRAKFRKERLSWEAFQNEDVPSLTGKATHVVNGITYGAEAFCVLAQDLETNFDEKDEVYEKAKMKLSDWGTKIMNGLEDNKTLTEFQSQLSSEDMENAKQIKCRLYADLQSQAVRECDIFDAYRHFNRLIDEGKRTDVGEFKPISISLLPLKCLVTGEAGNLFPYRDLDEGLLSRCSRVWAELEDTVRRAEVVRANNRNSRASLDPFIDTMDKFQEIIRKDLKNVVTKARESEDGEKELSNLISAVEKHPLFKTSQLNRWLSLKKGDEPEMLERINKTQGITVFDSERSLLNGLADLYGKYALVLCIPPVDQRTKSILNKMEDWVTNNETLLEEITPNEDSKEEERRDEEEEKAKRKKVQDKIRELSKHAEKNKHLESQVRFLIFFGKTEKEYCHYTVYESDNVLKGNLDKLPYPPIGLKIKTKKSSYIHLEWNCQEFEYPFGHYLVEYRLKGSSDPWKQQKTTKSGENRISINFKDGSAMEIRVAADTCIGRSEFSGIISTESDDDTEIENRGSDEEFEPQTVLEKSKLAEAKHKKANMMVHKPTMQTSLVRRANRDQEIFKDKLQNSVSKQTFGGIDRNGCIKMAALGRPFKLGNLYDYRNDLVTGKTK